VVGPEVTTPVATQGTLAVHSPWTGREVGRVQLADRSAVRAAFARGAGAAVPETRHERAQVLFGVADRLAARADELARLITAESGLCLKDTRHELRRAQDVFRFGAMEALRDDGETYACETSANGRDRRAHTLRVPVGLAAAITPFNHPVNQVAHKVAPAMAVGAPMVLKPSERTPLSALALLDVIRDAGWPEDSLQVLCADPREFLDEALADDAVEVVTFTDGVAVGRHIAGRLGYRRAVLELGGNDPLLVLADADLGEAARLAVQGAFANSGQRCTAVKRIVAVAEIADELVERIEAGARALVAGDPEDEATDMGTVISEDAARAIAARVDDAVAAGATLRCGGGHDGALVPPTVLDRVPADADLVREETFGPVAPVIRVRDLDEALAVANGARYALSAGVVTFDWRAIARCVRELRAGTVNVREVPGYRTELTPFGGVGDSGLGVKEGVREAMRALSTVKLYTLPWN
jgi:phosphonoacetaldehyde dehydrogenase